MQDAKEFILSHADALQKKISRGREFVISEHEDRLTAHERGFGEEMAAETGTEDQIPSDYHWDVLASKSGIELKKFYKELSKRTPTKKNRAQGNISRLASLLMLSSD